MALPPWIESDSFESGRPRPFARFRYIHACGHRGKWTDSTAAQIGYRTHDRHCRASPLVKTGARYALQYVGGGHDVWVLVCEGEHASAHSQTNWLLKDTDDLAGAQRIVRFVARFGGTILNAGAVRLPDAPT